VNNTVGGAGEPARNIISGNVGDGVRIIDSSSANLVQGNFIGTNLDGTQRFGNLGNGVEINSFSSANTIGGTTEAARNVISGNGLDGILIQLSPANPEPGNYVQGNYIGTDQSGTNSLGNLHNGVSILDAPNNLIGGILTGAGNVISGNGQDGILIVTINVSSGSTGDLVQGNFIGTDATGANPLGNQDNGVALTGAAGITIGGTTARARNIISSNILNGIAISDISPAQDGKPQVIIVGNFIGTDATGTRNLGNAADGVLLDTAASNLIGGTTPEARNILSGNSV